MTTKEIKIFLISILVITGLLILILVFNIINSDSTTISTESDLISESIDKNKLLINNPVVYPNYTNPTISDIEEEYRP